jgi:hypothetical protein
LAEGLVIQGNLIGTDVTGKQAIPNGVGMVLRSNATVGGTVPEARNTISGNTNVGIYIPDNSFVIGERNVIQGNFIGPDITGTSDLGNGTGIYMAGTRLNRIEHNTIAFNNIGVNIIASSVPSSDNVISENAMFGNSDLGIDLNADGLTANDNGDADTGPNSLQNFPVISYVTRDAGKLKVTYNVPSDIPNSTYPMVVEFFLADADGQEGQTYLGSDMFTQTDHDAGGKTIALSTVASFKVLDKIVATATDSLTAADGGGPANTSEFSPSVTIVSPWRNPGRLRWDVTDDTFVSADDVLAVINYVNAHGSGLLPDDAKNEKPYVDVDGDNNVVAADVIDIINYINAGRQLGGEAEATDPVAGGHEPVISDVMALLAADVAAQATRKRK